jgi:hypothetical protein
MHELSQAMLSGVTDDEGDNNDTMMIQQESILELDLMKSDLKSDNSKNIEIIENPTPKHQALTGL